jgi:hypothetical protein
MDTRIWDRKEDAADVAVEVKGVLASFDSSFSSEAALTVPLKLHPWHGTECVSTDGGFDSTGCVDDESIGIVGLVGRIMLGRLVRSLALFHLDHLAYW